MCGGKATVCDPPAHAGGTDLHLHGIIFTMKSFFMTANSTHPLPQVVLTSMFLAIGISIACTAYKSAGSQPLANNSKVSQPPTPTNTAGPQEKTACTLTLAGAPVINGLKLGMTADEVLALFPGSKEDAEVRASLSRPPSQFGTSSFVIRPDRYQSKEKFTGIN